jgi:diaminohydroxyphosphoribosylaminopyrimidine deaminase/5-amino-6-(5-phosphoribosylamino)uracil reductase
VEDVDERHMRRAIELGATVRTSTPPNPWVGAVLVTADGATWEGTTAPPGGHHAEIDAIGAATAAGTSPRRGVLYATLEPCVHHGRTGPCAEAIIEAGIERVVIGVLDPDPQVAGRGFERLRDAGVVVDVGVAAAEVEDQLAAYLHHRSTGRPYVVLKLAATVDGRTAAPDGSSQWITGIDARTDAHRLRAESQAVIVGAGTVRADDPTLTTRLVDGPDPLRVVLGRAPAGARIHPCEEWTPTDGDLPALLERLGRRGVLQVLVEGGARVAASFHGGGLVDRYVIYLAPALSGGGDAPGLFSGAGAPSIGRFWRGEIATVDRLGDDLRIELQSRRDATEAYARDHG